MEQQLRARLDELRTELDTGTTRLREIEAEAHLLQQTLLRISGAIQVLDEELAKAAGPTAILPGPRPVQTGSDAERELRTTVA